MRIHRLLDRLSLGLLVSLMLVVAPSAFAKLNVVASIKPVYDLTEGVVHGVANLELLVPENMSPHLYTLKPSDQENLSQADVFIWIGPQMELFLEKLQKHISVNTEVISLISAPGVKTLRLSPDSTTGAVDPHIWLNPDNAIAMVQEIALQLGKKDPQNAALYKSNAQRMQKKLETLDHKIAEKTQAIQKQPFFIYHDGMAYFDEHYHLTLVDAVTDINENQQGARHLQALQQQIKNAGHTCLFIEPGIDPKQVEYLVEGTNTSVVELDILGIHTPLNFEGYQQMMRSVAETLVGCLIKKHSP